MKEGCAKSAKQEAFPKTWWVMLGRLFPAEIKGLDENLGDGWK